MSTAAQITANQRNAQHSTGPRTEAGKAISAQNNFRHGLRGAFTVLPHENQADFDALRAALVAEHQPASLTEDLLVDNMAQHEWRSRRTLAIIDQLMETGCDDPKLLAVWLRYQTCFTRGFHKCLTELTRLRAERRRDQIGFERQTVQRAAEARRQQTADARNRNLHAQAAARELATAARAARSASSTHLPNQSVNEIGTPSVASLTANEDSLASGVLVRQDSRIEDAPFAIL